MEVPVLGICVGHQFLGRHFGGRVVRGTPEFGAAEITVDRPDHPIFAGLPTHLKAWSNHNDSVVVPPPGWSVLAHSPDCPVQAMAHPTKVIWGVQFHPEVTLDQVESWIRDPEDPPPDADGLHAATLPRIAAWNELGRELCAGFVEAAERAATTSV